MLRVAVKSSPRERGDEIADGQGTPWNYPANECGGCSTIELGRHLEPATGVEPITCDNPQLRPIKGAGARPQSGQGAIWIALSLYRIELFALKREDGFEPSTYSVR